MKHSQGIARRGSTQMRIARISRLGHFATALWVHAATPVFLPLIWPSILVWSEPLGTLGMPSPSTAASFGIATWSPFLGRKRPLAKLILFGLFLKSVAGTYLNIASPHGSRMVAVHGAFTWAAAPISMSRSCLVYLRSNKKRRFSNHSAPGGSGHQHEVTP